MASDIVATAEPDAAPSLIPSSPAVSAQMSRFPRRDTSIELSLRRLLHRRGLRYRVQLPVPGLPRRSIDIAFTKAQLAVFVDGCFWHGCPDHGRIPRSNRGWWMQKIERNRERDVATTRHLHELGWVVVRLWAHADVEPMAEEVCACLDHRRPLARPGRASTTL